MSSTITIASPTRPGKASASTAGVSTHQPPRHKKIHTRQRVTKAMKRFEDTMHYTIAFVLSGIAIATMIETTRTLLMTPSTTTFATATSNAVGGVLIVLILVEITRTVITPPDSKGVAIRRLLVIAIMSAVREVLWVGVNSDASASTGKSLAMAISSAVVVGLAVAFTLVRRTSSDPAN